MVGVPIFLAVFLYACMIFIFSVYVNLVELSDIVTCYACKELDQLEPAYDYIVVGCGSAGSIAALRLAEHKHASVLVLEAGANGGTLFDIPMLGPLLQLSPFDWQYRTVPQRHAAGGLDQRISNWPMGKVVGGSSRLNNMVYIRGHPEDFREWFAGVENYDYKTHVLYYFKKSENYKGRYSNDSTYHSTRGPLVVDDLPFTSPVADPFLQAAEELGYPVRDLNGQLSTGFMATQAHVRHGNRWTPAHHLTSYAKPNLVLQTNSVVKEVLFKRSFEAYAVRYSYLGQKRVTRANKAIILCAGAIGTPKILMLSGIGPKEHVKALGIKPRRDLPVGENLQDHVTTGLDLITLNATLNLNLLDLLSSMNIFQYLFKGAGPWTATGCEAVALLNTDNIECVRKVRADRKTLGNISDACMNSTSAPDLEIMLIPAGITNDGGTLMKHAISIEDKLWRQYFSPLVGKSVITILPILLHPRSKGTVRLTGADFSDPLEINPNYLSDHHDVRVLLKGIEFVKEIVATEAMQKLGAQLYNKSLPGCEHIPFDTPGYWECYVRRLTITAYHPGGTAKMGNQRDSVVDFDFHVHGTNKLFVVDGSVMPSLPSGNPNAAIMMLAEKAVDEIKNLEFQMAGKCRKRDFFKKQICRFPIRWFSFN